MALHLEMMCAEGMLMNVHMMDAIGFSQLGLTSSAA